MKALRAAFVDTVSTELNAWLDKLYFIDESGVNLGLTRLFGRAAPGERVVEGTPGISGLHYTLVAALNLAGVQAPLILPDAMNRECFEQYVRQFLAPLLQPGDIVLLDNLGAHKGGQIQAAIEARGARLIYLPPYSPDLNPIEQFWSKVKTLLRALKARTQKALFKALERAFDSVTLADITAWFAHCGYALNP